MSNRSKSLAAAKFILDHQKVKGDSITPMQLIKLVYIAQGYMLGQHGKPLLDEDVEAWQYGPVVPSVYQAVKQFRSQPVADVRADLSVLSAEERALLQSVAEHYAKFDGITLSSATHKPGTPWYETWNAKGKSSPISNDLIENFYSNLLKQPTHSAL